MPNENLCKNKKIEMINRKKLFAYKSGIQNWFINCFLCNFPSIRFRRWCLQQFGIKMTNNVRFYEGFHIRTPRNITIEDGVSVGPHVLLDGRMGLHIGKSAVLGYECIIWTLNHDYNDVFFLTYS